MDRHQNHQHSRDHDRRALALTLAITAAYCLVELAGGVFTNSLALLSDAGHMFADVAALGISLFAARLSQLQPTASKTFGYHRVEILAAFVNGLALWLVVGLIFHEAYQRVHQPPIVGSVGMIVIAAIGLAVNVFSLQILRHSQAASLNVRAAFVHVLGDALGSIGALVAGVTMLIWGWYLADPLVSVGIGGLILYSSWGIVRESVDILMQGTPREMRLQDIERCLLAIASVREVHDLHVWTLTSGRYLLSVHLVVSPGDATRPVIDAAQTQLRERFGIGHTTVQVDTGEECTEEFRAH
ncbi:MAG TPA: cation diffusion facilitator family transporter [Candidatus Margulisiibacteriota bacterium]|nr:cation diffusion facilitator family transporter [Candidatus Margulisiibacteriota bacterium]